MIGVHISFYPDQTMKNNRCTQAPLRNERDQNGVCVVR